jgi:hypothetical protein
MIGQIVEMSNPEKKSGVYLSGLGAMGTIFSASLAMGCCAGLLAPVASVGAATLPFLDSSFQMPLLYAAVVVTLFGLVISYRRQGSISPLLLGLLGAFLLLVPFHEALELSLFYLFISVGLSALLVASWLPLIRRGVCGNP